MSHPYIVEFDEIAAGIIAPEGRGFRFHHADRSFIGLDGQIFANYWQAERAARTLLAASKASAGQAHKAASRFASRSG